MFIFKIISLFLTLFIYITVAMSLQVLLHLIAPRLRLRIISQWTRMFSKLLRLILRINIVIAGERKRLNESGNFIISNHLSFLDGVVLGSLFAVIYTSKSEVKTWPLFGLMAQAGGTIFIDREKKHKSPDYICRVTEALKNKANLLVFPEGTSTNGERLLPFQPVHFQPPLIIGSAILPITIFYTGVNHQKVDSGNRDKVCWYGRMKLIPHLLGMMRMNNIGARVIIHPKIELDSQAEEKYTRRQLSEYTHKIISSDYPIFNK